MKKIKKLSPKILIGMEFNIPLFSAYQQLYICTNVEDTKNGSGEHKNYTLYFQWIHSNYNVPETLEVDLYITDSNSSSCSVTIFEINQFGKRIQLHQNVFAKNDSRTINRIKEIIKMTATK